MTHEFEVKTQEKFGITPEQFAAGVIKNISPSIERYSLVENPQITPSELGNQIEKARSSQEIGVVLGNTIIVDDSNLVQELFALTPKSLSGQFTQETLLAAAIATAKADKVEKSGVSGKVKQKLQTFKDDILWFMTGKASSSEGTWKRNVKGKARRSFMNKAALMGSALLLAACGVPGVVGAVSSPDGGPFPTPASATMPPEKSSTPTTTPTETATPTAEIINYGICETEKFRECSIPSEDLFNGKYLAFLETLSKPFDVNTMKQVPWINVGPDNFLAPDITTAPNFTNISTIGAESGADFRRGVTSGITTYEGKNYMVLPVEFYDKENPDKNVWVITIYPLFFQKQDYPESLDAKLFDAWRNRTKVPALYIEKGPDTQIFGNTPVLSYKTFDEDPSMAQRLADFVAGKRSSLHGKVLRTALDFRKSDIYN